MLFKLIIFLLICLQPILSVAQEFKNEFGFKSDNDSYLATGQDRYYTNGLFIHFRHASNQDSLKPTLAKKVWEAEIGQKMFNAISGSIADINLVDRPFAGYLYAGVAINWFFKNEQLLKLSLQTGVIGPNALGKEAQEFLHNTFGFYKVNGWQFQLNNQFEINSSVQYSKLLVRSPQNKIDLISKSYANVGTTFSGLGSGILFRAGKINPLYKSASFNSRVSNNSKEQTEKEFFFFAQPGLNFIAYDATIRGGIFLDNKGPVTFKTKPVVFSQNFGVAYAAKRWTLNYAITFKTREVKSSARPHQYGSISAAYQFN